VGRADETPAGTSGSLRTEAVARRARYGFLRHTAARLGARYVATAHTADDQAETILHRIVRGTGIAGLAGIPRIRRLGEAATLIRPLLGLSRAELVGYLGALGQPYRMDSSNADLRYTRNRLRHELLPRIRRHFNPRATEALGRLGQLAGEVQELVDALAGELLEACAPAETAEGVRLDVGPLVGQPAYLVCEALVVLWRGRGWPLRSMGRVEWDALAAMALDPSPAKRTFPGGLLVERRAEELVVRQP